MANIYIRRSARGTESVSNNVNNGNGSTTNGNDNARSIGQQTSSESYSDVDATTGDDNSVDTTVNTTFNPNDYEFVDPESGTVNGNSNNDGRKRRRRSDAGIKRGTRGTRNSRSNETETTKDIAAMLLTVHFGLSKLLKIDKLKLAENEAEQLSKAITRVTSLYDVPLLSEKQRAWGGLIFTAGCIYLPRLKKDKNNAAEKQQQPANVVQMK